VEQLFPMASFCLSFKYYFRLEFSISILLHVQSNPLSIATTQDHGRAWLLWTGGLYIQVNYIGNTQGGRREQVVASTGCRYIQVVAKAGLTVHIVSFKLQ
jgi:hypothetical protein